MDKYQKDKVVGAIKIEKPVTAEDVETVIVNGFEGGCNYWLGLDNKDRVEWEQKPIDTPNSIWVVQLLLNGETVHLYDIEDKETTWRLTLDDLIGGIQMNVEKRPYDSDIENGDAVTADCIIQYALFNEILFS